MNTENLKGKTALITGAARRIGRAMALELGRLGIHVLAHYNRSEREINTLLEELKPLGVKTAALQADLADPGQVEQLFTEAREQAGELDILINNASIFPRGTLLEFSPAELQENIQVNSQAPLELGRAFFRQQHPGSIINLLDTRILDYDSKHVAYHLSKRMLFSLTRMMALEFAPAVRVNAIAPGVILTPIGGDDTDYQAMLTSTPLQEHGTLENITDAMVFLLLNSFVTGQVLYVDGGRHMLGSMYGR